MVNGKQMQLDEQSRVEFKQTEVTHYHACVAYSGTGEIKVREILAGEKAVIDRSMLISDGQGCEEAFDLYGHGGASIVHKKVI